MSGKHVILVADVVNYRGQCGDAPSQSFPRCNDSAETLTNGRSRNIDQAE